MLDLENDKLYMFRSHCRDANQIILIGPFRYFIINDERMRSCLFGSGNVNIVRVMSCRVFGGVGGGGI